MSAGSVIPAVMEKTCMELIQVTYRRIRSWARDGSVGSSAAPGGSSPVIGLTMPQARAGWIDFKATRWPGTTPSTGSRGPIPDPHLEPRTGANGNGFVGLIGFATALGGSGGAKLLPPAVSYAGLLLSFRGRWNTRMG